MPEGRPRMSGRPSVQRRNKNRSLQRSHFDLHLFHKLGLRQDRFENAVLQRGLHRIRPDLHREFHCLVEVPLLDVGGQFLLLVGLDLSLISFFPVITIRQGWQLMLSSFSV